MQTFRQNRAALLLAAAFTLAGSATISAQQPAVVDSAVLRKAGTPADPFPGTWLTYGKSQNETRYSPLKLIDALRNVKRLGLEWSYVVGAGGYNQEGTPLVWNNTIYGSTTWSVVYAVDARTGKEIWRWDPEINQRPRGINAARGLALYNGKIYAPALDGRLIALDAMTGKPVWEARVAWPQDGYYITMAPRDGQAAK